MSEEPQNYNMESLRNLAIEKLNRDCMGEESQTTGQGNALIGKLTKLDALVDVIRSLDAISKEHGVSMAEFSDSIRLGIKGLVSEIKKHILKLLGEYKMVCECVSMGKIQDPSKVFFKPEDMSKVHAYGNDDDNPIAIMDIRDNQEWMKKLENMNLDGERNSKKNQKRKPAKSSKEKTKHLKGGTARKS